MPTSDGADALLVPASAQDLRELLRAESIVLERYLEGDRAQRASIDALERRVCDLERELASRERDLSDLESQNAYLSSRLESLELPDGLPVPSQSAASAPVALTAGLEAELKSLRHRNRRLESSLSSLLSSQSSRVRELEHELSLVRSVVPAPSVSGLPSASAASSSSPEKELSRLRESYLRLLEDLNAETIGSVASSGSRSSVDRLLRHMDCSLQEVCSVLRSQGVSSSSDPFLYRYLSSLSSQFLRSLEYFRSRPSSPAAPSDPLASRVDELERDLSQARAQISLQSQLLESLRSSPNPSSSASFPFPPGASVVSPMLPSFQPMSQYQQPQPLPLQYQPHPAQSQPPPPPQAPAPPASATQPSPPLSTVLDMLRLESLLESTDRDVDALRDRSLRLHAHSRHNRHPAPALDRGIDSRRSPAGWTGNSDVSTPRTFSVPNSNPSTMPSCPPATPGSFPPESQGPAPSPLLAETLSSFPPPSGSGRSSVSSKSSLSTLLGRLWELSSGSHSPRSDFNSRSPSCERQ